MAWGGGVFTRTYGSTAWQTDASNNVGIVADRHDTNDQDLADGINACINKAGGNTPTADLPMGGYKHTNLSAGSAAAPTFCAGNDQDTGIYSPAANQIGIATNGAERVRIDANGNLGIGTTTPGETLHLRGNSPRIRIEDTDGGSANVYGQISGNSATGNVVIQADVLNGAANSFIGFDVDSAERMRIDSNGRVAIGTSVTTGGHLTTRSGTYSVPQLLVQGTGTGSGGSGRSGINIDVDGNGGWLLENNASGGSRTFIISDNNGFGVGAIERFRITNAGSVGIGNVSPSSILDVGDGAGQKVVTCSAGNSGTSGGSSFWCRNGGVTQSAFGGWSSIIGGAYDATTTVWAAGAMRFVSGGGSNERITLTSTGNVGIGGITPSYLLQLNTDSAAKPTTNTWTIASDERIKTNIQPYEKGLTEILQVEPITYDYNGKGGISAGPGGISILAQALQPIFPECIGSYKGKLNEDDAEETDILNYNGHAMTFALINAVKELSAKLDTLTDRVTALEA